MLQHLKSAVDPACGSTNHVPLYDGGFLPTVRCVGVPSFRSADVRDVACLLDMDPTIGSWSCNPPPFALHRSMVMADFSVTREEAMEFIIVDDRCLSAEPLQFPETKSRILVIRADQIDRDRLLNAREILQYAHWPVPLSDRIRLLAALDAEGSLTLADCLSTERADGNVIALIAAMAVRRELVIDLDSGRIGPETRITRFGR